MLVITRREGDELYLSLAEDVEPGLTAREMFRQPIRIMVTGADGAIRLGIDAPKEIKIGRDEVWVERKRV